MKIEKGKLYYYTALGKLEKAEHSSDIKDGLLTDKIAVHCPTKENWEYVVSKGYKLTTTWYKDSNYGLYSGTFFCSKKDYHVITIDQFKEFYPPQIDQGVYSKVNMKIKKGNKFLCIKDVIMFDGDIAYKKGEIYQSECDGCITNAYREDCHRWTSDDAPHIYFKLLSDVDRAQEEDYDDPYNWVVNGMKMEQEVFNPKSYYDNSKGSLYKVATERGWSSYIFDVVKRLERGGKKDPLRQEIEKSIDVLKIWLNEID